MSLRVVSDQDAPANETKAGAIERVMRECIASDPMAVVVAWEVKGELHTRVIPGSPAVFMGLLYLLSQEYLGGDER